MVPHAYLAQLSESPRDENQDFFQDLKQVLSL